MDAKKYSGSKFNGLRDRERRADIYRSKSMVPTKSVVPKNFLNTDERIKTIEMLINNSKMKPNPTGECRHVDYKKVYISNIRAFMVCRACEANLGEADDN